MADITSANVVGYKTEAMTAGKFNMHSVQFNQVGKEGFNLNEDLIIPNVVGSDDASTSDQIQLWNPATSGYATYYFYDDGEESGWCDFVSGDYFEDVSDPLPAGTAFWYNSRANAKTLDMTSSGEVDSDSDTTIVLTTGKFNLVGNPYPVSYSLNDDGAIVFTNPIGSDDASTSDQIQLWNPATSGYTTYYLYDDGEESGWCDFVSGDYFEDVSDPIQAGVAWWYNSRANAKELSVTFKKTF